MTTVEEMVDLMQDKYGKAERVWVMDRGMVSEDNIASLQSCGARYPVGTPKSMLRKFEHDLTDKDWQEVAPGVEVKLCAAPDGTNESFVLCRSEGRKDKETAILNRFITRLEAGLDKSCQHCAAGTEDPASETEAASARQTKGY